MKILSLLALFLFAAQAQACEIFAKYPDGSGHVKAGEVDASGEIFHDYTKNLRSWGRVKNNEVFCDACDTKAKGKINGTVYSQYFQDVKDYARLEGNKVISKSGYYFGEGVNCTATETLAGVLVLLVYTE